jgi:hypothetical protein
VASVHRPKVGTDSTRSPSRFSPGPRNSSAAILVRPFSQKFISGARRCTKVHGGVLRATVTPTWGGLHGLRPCKTENRSSFGKVSVKFSSGGSTWPLGPSGRAPKGGDKTRQNIPKRAITRQNLRIGQFSFCRTVRFWSGFGPVSVQNRDTLDWRDPWVWPLLPWPPSAESDCVALMFRVESAD